MRDSEGNQAGHLCMNKKGLMNEGISSQEIVITMYNLQYHDG